MRASERGQSRVKKRSTASLSGLLKSIGCASRVRCYRRRARSQQRVRNGDATTDGSRAETFAPAKRPGEPPDHQARFSAQFLRRFWRAPSAFPLSQGTRQFVRTAIGRWNSAPSALKGKGYPRWSRASRLSACCRLVCFILLTPWWEACKADPGEKQDPAMDFFMTEKELEDGLTSSRRMENVRGLLASLPSTQAFLLDACCLTRIRSGLPSTCSISKAFVLRTRSLSLRKP